MQIPFHGFGDLRNRAIAECRHEWIFSLDSDERCTPEVRDEILAILSSTPAHDAYLVPRRNYMMGRWIRGLGLVSEFSPAAALPQGAMRYDNDPVHEGYELLTQLPLGQLQSAIWQFPFRNLEEIISKMNRYSSLGVRKLSAKQVSMAGALGHATMGVHQALPVQARLPRRLGGLRHRVGKFRRHVLPLRQTLRGDAGLGPAPPSAPLRRPGASPPSAAPARADTAAR